MKCKKPEPGKLKKNAIQGNCYVPSDLPAAVQDLADLLVEVALKQLASEKKLQLEGVKPNEK